MLGVTLLLTAPVVGSASFSRAVTVADPYLAAKIWPWNAAAFARMAANDVDIENNASNVLAMSLAKRALEIDPLNTVAMRTIGLVETKQGRLAQALRAFGLVERMTRRDVGTNLWMVEYYANRNDVHTVLSFYDRALRTSGKAPALMFPVLLGALEDDVIRSSFVKRFSKSPPDWLNDFFAFAVGNANAPAAFADVFAAVPSASSTVPQEKVAIFVDRMAHAFQPAAAGAAIRMYESRTGRTVATESVTFVDALTNADSSYLFDWTPASPGEIAIDRGDAPATLLVSMSGGFNGVILQRTVALKPRRYALRLKKGDGDLPVEIVLTCVASSAILPVVGGRFDIGPGCPLQNIVISATEGGKDKVIGPFSITPATSRE